MNASKQKDALKTKEPELKEATYAGEWRSLKKAALKEPRNVVAFTAGQRTKKKKKKKTNSAQLNTSKRPNSTLHTAPLNSIQ